MALGQTNSNMIKGGMFRCFSYTLHKDYIHLVQFIFIFLSLSFSYFLCRDLVNYLYVWRKHTCHFRMTLILKVLPQVRHSCRSNLPLSVILFSIVMLSSGGILLGKMEKILFFKNIQSNLLKKRKLKRYHSRHLVISVTLFGQIT